MSGPDLISIQQISNSVFIESLDLRIQVRINNYGPDPPVKYLNIFVCLGNKYWGDTVGLLGTYDGNNANDDLKPDGTAAANNVELGESCTS